MPFYHTSQGPGVSLLMRYISEGNKNGVIALASLRNIVGTVRNVTPLMMAAYYRDLPAVTHIMMRAHLLGASACWLGLMCMCMCVVLWVELWLPVVLARPA
jgi:hypothetical protein